MSLHFSQLKTSPHFIERLWDIWCVCSILGIWPRFIEPKMLCTTELTLEIPTLPKAASGLKVLQMSDLHFSSYTPHRFLQRISRRIRALNPDIIVFTGDLISYSLLEDSANLKEFLQSLYAPQGVFAILGNHDYESYVSLGEDNTPRLIQEHISPLLKGFYRLLSAKKKNDDPQVTSPLKPLQSLQKLFSDCGIQLLHNETIETKYLNITGLGDLMTLNCSPEVAFRNRNGNLPTIVLSHNPDSYQELAYYPGDLICFGHTHGGQVNLPFIWKKVTPIVNKALKSGLHRIDNRYLYINRGLGSSFPFRWFAPPEITLFTLVRGQSVPIKESSRKRVKQPEFTPYPAPTL